METLTQKLTVFIFVTSLSVSATTARPGSQVVTVNEGTNIAATVSPDHKTLIFDLQGALWSLPFAGGKAHRLTDPLLEPARPNFSPTGNLVAFEAYKGGTFHIWTMNPDGSNLRQVTNGHGDDREPYFSPDGTQIAFSSDRAFEASYDIWVVNLITGALERRTKSPDDEYEPAWSPDGSEIAFVSGTGPAATRVLAINASGTIRTIASAPAGAHVNSPSWAPDGKSVAWIEFARNASRLVISGTPAGKGDDVFPFPVTWIAPNRILYAGDGKIRVTNLDDGKTQDIPFQAEFTLKRPAYRHKVVDLDSTNERPAKGIVSPTLSPDGKQIVFEALNQLWLLNIAGGKPRQLTSDKYYKEDPTWSPEGRRIAYSSDKAGIENLYILDLTTYEEKRVTTQSDSAEVSAAWSPDGRKLAYQDQNGAT